MSEDLSSSQASQGSIREHQQALAGPPASCSQHHCWQDKESLVVWLCYPTRGKGVWQSCPVPLTGHRQRLLLSFLLGPISSLPGLDLTQSLSGSVLFLHIIPRKTISLLCRQSGFFSHQLSGGQLSNMTMLPEYWLPEATGTRTPKCTPQNHRNFFPPTYGASS